MASIAPKTPTTPSYFPEYGMASMCEPVATAASSGSRPSLKNAIKRNRRLRGSHVLDDPVKYQREYYKNIILELDVILF